MRRHLTLVEDLCPARRRHHIEDFTAWGEDAERRHERGERQVLCGHCERYVWPDHRAACPRFTPGDEDFTPGDEDLPF